MNARTFLLATILLAVAVANGANVGQQPRTDAGYLHAGGVAKRFLEKAAMQESVFEAAQVDKMQSAYTSLVVALGETAPECVSLSKRIVEAKQKLEAKRVKFNLLSKVSEVNVTGALTLSDTRSEKATVAKIGECVLEDHLFGMDATQKAELSAEIYSGPIANSISYVMSHPNAGWTKCAEEGQVCTCAGKARYGVYSGHFSSFTAEIPINGAVLCNAPAFASTLAWTQGMHCQCAATPDGWQSNIKKRFNSKSYLQESWIMLTRIMAHGGLLPMHGDRLMGGEGLFGGRGGGSHDRSWIDIFLEESKAYLSGGPEVCIEWTPVVYLSRFPGCVSGESLALEYTPLQANMKLVPGVGNAATVYSDNVNLPQVLGPQKKLTLVLSTQVWEHESEPFAAIHSMYEAMAPGGIILFTIPFVAPYHGVPHDYYRYTKSGVVHVLEKAGFCVPRSRMRSGGDFIYDMALMAGVGPGDFSQDEIQTAYKRGYDNIPDGAMVIMAVAHKKSQPTDICPP